MYVILQRDYVCYTAARLCMLYCSEIMYVILQRDYVCYTAASSLQYNIHRLWMLYIYTLQRKQIWHVIYLHAAASSLQPSLSVSNSHIGFWYVSPPPFCFVWGVSTDHVCHIFTRANTCCSAYLSIFFDFCPDDVCHIFTRTNTRETNQHGETVFGIVDSTSICWRGGGLGSSTISKNLMSPTPRRKWYLTTGRRAH